VVNQRPIREAGGGQTRFALLAARDGLYVGVTACCARSAGVIARALIITVLAVGAAVTAAACGSSSAATSAAGKTGRSQFVAFSVCMRSHGVPNFPDPGPNGLQITPSSGLNPRSPAFQAAQQACQKLLPGGGPGHASPSNRQRLLALAQCMRRHGLTNFPDPTIFQGGVPSGQSIVIDGYEFKLGAGLDPQSPMFQQAMRACGGPGAPGKH
jgi:hypothetical protein